MARSRNAYPQVATPMNFFMSCCSLKARLLTHPALVCLVGLATIHPASASAEQPAISRRPLEHKDYDAWKTINTSQISRDGQWVMYQVQSGAVDSDPVLHVRSTRSAKQYTIERGGRGRFSFDSRFIVYLVSPSKQAVEDWEKKKSKSGEKPTSRLQILELDSGSSQTIDRVTSFNLPEESPDWIGYRLEKLSDAPAVKKRNSDVRETYEVTPSGLRRPEKKWKLKPRTPALPEEQISGNETAESGKKAHRIREQRRRRRGARSR